MAIREKRYTVDDLRAIEQLSENTDRRFELVEGVIYEVAAAPSPTHAYISGEIFSAIRNYVKQHQSGFAFGDSVSYTLAGDYEFIPDASFIAKERQPTLPEKFLIAPDLAVEVVSPSNRPREILDKVESYLRYGARLVWVVYPDERVVDVYRLADDGSLNLRKVDCESTLDGGEVLPGFKLAVREIFP